MGQLEETLLGDARDADDRYLIGRLLALSDGVFAIAMTLLVLDIPLPELAHHTNADLLAALQDLVPNVASFALSFILVGLYWLTHRGVLRGVTRTDTRLVVLNLMMLLLVCVVPFTAGVLSHYGDLATAVILYASNVGLLGAMAVLIQLHLSRRRLLAPFPGPAQRRMALVAGAVSAGIFAASIPLALFSPSVAEFSWLLVAMVRPAIGRLMAHRAG
jgi:uncharacterized membrane protein